LSGFKNTFFYITTMGGVIKYVFLCIAVSICFQQSVQNIPEGSNTATIVLNITNPFSESFTIRVNNVDGTATGEHLLILIHSVVSSTIGDVDYGSGPYTVQFTAGQTSASFTIAIIDDNVFEDDETFSLTIDPSSLPSRVMILSGCRLDGTIVDNDCE